MPAPDPTAENSGALAQPRRTWDACPREGSLATGSAGGPAPRPGEGAGGVVGLSSDGTKLFVVTGGSVGGGSTLSSFCVQPDGTLEPTGPPHTLFSGFAFDPGGVVVLE